MRRKLLRGLKSGFALILMGIMIFALSSCGGGGGGGGEYDLQFSAVAPGMLLKIKLNTTEKKGYHENLADPEDKGEFKYTGPDADGYYAIVEEGATIGKFLLSDDKKIMIAQVTTEEGSTEIPFMLVGVRSPTTAYGLEIGGTYNWVDLIGVSGGATITPSTTTEGTVSISYGSTVVDLIYSYDSIYKAIYLGSSGAAYHGFWLGSDLIITEREAATAPLPAQTISTRRQPGHNLIDDAGDKYICLSNDGTQSKIEIYKENNKPYVRVTNKEPEGETQFFDLPIGDNGDGSFQLEVVSEDGALTIYGAILPDKLIAMTSNEQAEYGFLMACIPGDFTSDQVYKFSTVAPASLFSISLNLTQGLGFGRNLQNNQMMTFSFESDPNGYYKVMGDSGEIGKFLLLSDEILIGQGEEQDGNTITPFMFFGVKQTYPSYGTTIEGVYNIITNSGYLGHGDSVTNPSEPGIEIDPSSGDTGQIRLEGWTSYWYSSPYNALTVQVGATYNLYGFWLNGNNIMVMGEDHPRGTDMPYMFINTRRQPNYDILSASGNYICLSYQGGWAETTLRDCGNGGPHPCLDASIHDGSTVTSINSVYITDNGDGSFEFTTPEPLTFDGIIYPDKLIVLTPRDADYELVGCIPKPPTP